MNNLLENELFKEAKKIPKLPSCIKAMFIASWYLILGEILGEVFLYSIKYITIPLEERIPSLKLLLQLISQCIFTMLLVFNRVKFKEKRSLESIGLKKDGFLKKYFIGFFIGIILIGSVTLILFITGNAIINKNHVQPVGLFAIKSILIVLPGWIIQSATEEVLTRGWLMNVLGGKYTPLIGLIMSSTFFASLHLLNPNIGITSIINVTLTGVFYGLYTIKTKSLWGACGIHGAWNFFQGNVFGFNVSGLDVEVGSILDLNTSGLKWISGGEFGPEAGIVCTVINLIGILILIKLIKMDRKI